MTRLKTSSGQFGLIGGICRATSDCILVEEPSPISPAGRWKGSLYILAEPVPERGRGYHSASQAIKEISEAYYSCTSTSVTTCLTRAIRQANESLLQHNMEVSGHEKVTIGITCAVVRGKELFLAQGTLHQTESVVFRGVPPRLRCPRDTGGGTCKQGHRSAKCVRTAIEWFRLLKPNSFGLERGRPLEMAY